MVEFVMFFGCRVSGEKNDSNRRITAVLPLFYHKKGGSASFSALPQ